MHVATQPCEAAVDEPHIYAGWGKNHTYIIAFGDGGDITDVTEQYTADWQATLARRELSVEQVHASIQKVQLTVPAGDRHSSQPANAVPVASVVGADPSQSR